MVHMQYTRAVVPQPTVCPTPPHTTPHQTKPTTKVTGSKLPAFPISYDEYVRLSVVLQKGGPQVAKDAVLSVLRSIAFPVRLVPRGS